jgi:fructose-specific phosphotransferase system IIC component
MLPPSLESHADNPGLVNVIMCLGFSSKHMLEGRLAGLLYGYFSGYFICWFSLFGLCKLYAL